MGIAEKNQRGVEVWRRRTKAKIVAGFGGGCNKCGYDKCDQALDLHHIDPASKEFSISRIFKTPKAWNKVVEELKKCVMLCNRCHRELHSGLWSLEDIDVHGFTESDCENMDDLQTGTCAVCGSDTYWGRKTCSRSCAARLTGNVSWPQDDEFLKLIAENSKSQVARLLNVSRSGVDKHLKRITSKS